MLPQFLFCTDPNNDESGVYVLHTREPMILAQAHHIPVTTEEEIKKIEKTIEIGSRLEYEDETIFFSAEWVIPGDKLLSVSAQRRSAEVGRVMRKLADWYGDVIEKNDE